jgi:hypothetical protein
MRVPAVAQTAVVSPWKSVDVSEVHWVHSSLAHEWRTNDARWRRLLFSREDTCYTGGPADECSQKSRSPVTFRSSGFDQATISLDVSAVAGALSRRRSRFESRRSLKLPANRHMFCCRARRKRRPASFHPARSSRTRIGLKSSQGAGRSRESRKAVVPAEGAGGRLPGCPPDGGAGIRAFSERRRCPAPARPPGRPRR